LQLEAYNVTTCKRDNEETSEKAAVQEQRQPSIASFASNLAERHHSTTFKLANGLKDAMYCA
jgi:hypothetical protein